MERLTALDTEFLHLEDGVSHMHLGGMTVFEGDALTEDEVSGLIAAKLDTMPRYRQRLQPVPFEVGRPVWVDDPHFNLAYHVRSTALPAATDEALCRLMGRLMSHELDRRRPLWECWIVHGLPQGQWALISKVHHCLVDGIAGLELLSALLDVAPRAAPGEPATWSPSGTPSDTELVIEAGRDQLADLGRRLGSVPLWFRHPLRALAGAVAIASGLQRYVHDLAATPPTAIDGRIGPHRRWAHTTVLLDDVRTIREQLGGTVNDVVLTAVANGYRQLLLADGHDPARTEVRTLVPVSVRAPDRGSELGNRVSALLYDLPVGIEDPRERLEAVATQLRELKASHMADAGVAIASFADLVPPMVVGNVSRVLVRVARDRSQRSINTVTTNVPGPQLPLFCLDRRLVEHRPFVPISHGLRYGTAILSYDGRLCFGITGDYDTAPGVQMVADGISAGIDELLEVP